MKLTRFRKICIIAALLFNYRLLYPVVAYDQYIEYIKYKRYYHALTFEIFVAAKDNADVNNIAIEDIFAIITSESEWNTNVVSYAGAIGLMQIMPFHHPGPSWQLTIPSVNIRIGAAYYAYCLRLSHGNRREALRFYNAGPGSNAQWYYSKRNNLNYVNTIAYNSDVTKKLKLPVELLKVR